MYLEYIILIFTLLKHWKCKAMFTFVIYFKWLWASEYVQPIAKIRLVMLNFSDTIHIEGNWGDYYVSDNVSVTRLGPWANKVHHKWQSWEIPYIMASNFTSHCAVTGVLEIHIEMGGIIIASSVHENVCDIGVCLARK